MVVDISTFRLASHVGEDQFLLVDRRWQTELVPNREGFVRRTTVRRNGHWAVLTLWATEADVVAFEADSAAHEVRRAFDELVDAESLHSARYDTLD